MRGHGATCSVEEFAQAINVVFHEFESETYDAEHADMWASVPRQIGLLVDDSLNAWPDIPDRIRVLDIGCGTGLASDSLLKSSLAPRIASIDLLDTSQAMLRQASRKAQGWTVPATCREGLLDSIPAGSGYDLIVTCSVLHHIPDLAGFLRAVGERQSAGGVFLHLQDPNGDYLQDPELLGRMAQLAPGRFSQLFSRFAPHRVAARAWREITGKQGLDPVSRANRTLLERGVIATPLSTVEMYSITDIHAHDGEGISIAALREWLPGYDLVSQRAYGFFGRLASALPAHLRQTEEDLTARRAMNGVHIGAAWKRRPAGPR